MNSLDMLCQANQGAQSWPPTMQVKTRRRRYIGIWTRPAESLRSTLPYWKRVRSYKRGCSNEGELFAFICCSLDDLVILEGLLRRKRETCRWGAYRILFESWDLTRTPRSQNSHDCYLKYCQPRVLCPGWTLRTFIFKKLLREMFAATRTRAGKIQSPIKYTSTAH